MTTELREQRRWALALELPLLLTTSVLATIALVYPDWRVYRVTRDDEVTETFSEGLFWQKPFRSNTLEGVRRTQTRDVSTYTFLSAVLLSWGSLLLRLQEAWVSFAFLAALCSWVLMGTCLLYFFLEETGDKTRLLVYNDVHTAEVSFSYWVAVVAFVFATLYAGMVGTRWYDYWLRSKAYNLTGSLPTPAPAETKRRRTK
jgi:hypothetical protein